MSPRRNHPYRDPNSFPRSRGDEPVTLANVALKVTFSPLTRG